MEYPLESKVKLLRKELSNERKKKILLLLFVSLNVITFLILTYISFKLKNISFVNLPPQLIILLLFLLTSMLIVISLLGFLQTRKKLLTNRERLSLLFYILSKEEDKKLSKKYLNRLYKICFYENENKIKEEGCIFESYEILKNNFYKNLNLICKKINNLILTDKLSPFRKDLENFALLIISNEKSMIKESEKLLKNYQEISNFPKGLDKIKTSSIGKFFIIELIIIALLIIINFIFKVNNGILFTGFFTLTAANYTVNLHQN